MKSILLFIICFLCSAVLFAQFPSNPTTGQTNTKQTNVGAFEAQKGLKAGTFADTAAANSATYVSGVPFIIINTTNDGKVWYRNAAATQWIQFSVSGSGADGWLITGNSGTDTSENFAGTTDNMPFQLRAANNVIVSLDGNARIFSAGDINSVGGHSIFEVDDTDADTSRFTGIYKFNKLNFEIGGNTYQWPAVQGSGFLYDPGNHFLRWDNGSNGTTTGVDSITVDTMLRLICYWKQGVSTCQPLGSTIDSVRQVGDTSICFYYSGGATECFPANGNVITTSGIDSVTVIGNQLCWWDNGASDCVTINNPTAQYVVAASLNSDSTLYNFYNDVGVYLFSLPTLVRKAVGINGISITNSNDTTFIGQEANVSDYLVSTGGIMQVDTTVTVYATILYMQGGVLKSIGTDGVFPIPRADSGYYRVDLIYITSGGALDTVQGVEDTATLLPPQLPTGGIFVTYVTIFGQQVSLGANTGVNGELWSQQGNLGREGINYIGTTDNHSVRLISAGTTLQVLDSLGYTKFTRGVLLDSLSTGLNDVNSYRLDFRGGNSGTQTLSIWVDGYFDNPALGGAVYLSSGNHYFGADATTGTLSTNAPFYRFIGTAPKTSFNNTGGPYTIENEVQGATSTIFQLNQRNIYNTNKPIVQVGATGTLLIQTDSINAAIAASAIEELRSTTKGLLIPRMTGAQMNAISSPATGLLIYNTDSTGFCYYSGSTWVKIGGGGTSGWGLTGNSGTDSTANFIGTADGKPLLFRVNNDTVAKFGRLYNFQAGIDTKAEGYAAIALGEGNTASGNRSFVTGYGNTASGYASTAMGLSSNATGENSISIGNSSTASNVNSTAIGSNAQSSGEDATALGIGSNASGQNSSAFGYNATASATEATAIGYGANATVDNSTAIGSGVTVKTDTTIINTIARFAGNALAGTGKVPTAIDAYGNWTWQTPSGGSTDTSGFLHKSYNVTETVTGTKTATGLWTFSNNSTGSQGTLVNGFVQAASDKQGLLIANATGSALDTTNVHPLRVQYTLKPSKAALAIAGIDIAIADSGTVAEDHTALFQSTFTKNSTNTITNVYNNYAVNVVNSGTETNRYGYYAANATGSGTLTNQYMYYAEAPTKGGTLNYSFFSAGAGKLGLSTGDAEIGGGAIVGFGTGTAPGAVLEVRKLGANSLRLRNNSNWFQWTQPSGSVDVSFGSISGNNMKIYDGGNKTFFAPGVDSISNSGLWVNHSFATAYVSKSANYTLNNNDLFTNFDCTTGAFTATLPTAVGCKGRIYEVRKTDNSTNVLSVATTSSQTINSTYYGSSTSYVLYNQNEVLQLKSDGANWMVIGFSKGGLTTSSAGTLTLTYGRDYIFTGTTTTWTLPAVASTVYGRPNAITIKNRGSGAITLNTSGGGNDLYTTSAVNTLTINAGEGYVLMPDGTLINVE